MGGPLEVEEDTKSDVSEIQSQRTGSVLSGREESDTGGQDAADAPSDSQPGTCRNSQSHRLNVNSPNWLRYISFDVTARLTEIREHRDDL